MDNKADKYKKNKLILLLVFLANFLSTVRCSTRTCTSLDNFGFLFRNKNIVALAIDVVDDTGLVQCAAECHLRKKCKSFAFTHSNGRCALYAVTVQEAGNTVVNVPGIDTSNISDWPSVSTKCISHPLANKFHAAKTVI